MRHNFFSKSNLGRFGLMLLVVITLGCRSAATRSTDPLKSNPKIAAVLPHVTEAERHREEVKFLDNICRESNDPAVTEIIATYRRAEEARHRSESQCVAIYADVALACWPMLPSSDEIQSTPASAAQASAAQASAAQALADQALAGPSDTAALISQNSDRIPWLLYHRSLERLTQEAAHFGLLDPQRGICIVDADGHQRFIEITRQGFPWKPDDFNQLHVIDSPLRSHLKRYWSDPGIGVPMVAIRQRTEDTTYMSNVVPYSATAVLRPTDGNESSPLRQVNYADDSPVAVLELYDPLRTIQISDAHRQWELARDLSAPLGFAQSRFHRDNLKSFLNPSREDKFAGLRMLEPYQPGKIPIVFVHGLLSDRLTWIDLINDLRHSKMISEHYQIWLYQYPTGLPFVISSAEMRSSLQNAITELDPEGRDPALSEMVLIGHSMGGLVSKLLITESGTNLWNSVATRPFDEVKIAEEKRQKVEGIFFFEPLPFVKRVIFIGSPHQGSQIATSWVGVLGSRLVHPSHERAKTTKTILHDNPGVFTDLDKHFPTSVDLLRPDNPMLLATYNLPVNPAVNLHTIMGVGHPLRDGTDADGVVPVQSARHPGTVSERQIDSSHTALPDHPETTDEVIRILQEHLQP